jgi:hypothetical protein
MNTPRLGYTATLLPNGKVLIAGGGSCTVNAVCQGSNAELYDPATGTFIPDALMNTARSGQTATLLSNGTVLVAGGYSTDVTVVAPLATFRRKIARFE